MRQQAHRSISRVSLTIIHLPTVASITMANFLISSLLSLASLQGTMAAPKVYPEVIPGPGLPSLAELNLTSAQLYEMKTPEGN